MVAFSALVVSLQSSQNLQQTASWRLDVASLLAGLLLGAGLVLLYLRLRPRLHALRDQSVERVQQTQAWVRAGTEKRFQAETAAYVARYHLGKKWATLEECFVPPLVLDEPPLFLPAAVEPGDKELAPAPSPFTSTLIHLWPDLFGGIGLPPPQTRSLRELLLDGPRVILSSPAGWGKTTLLAYCAALCATASSEGPYSFLLPFVPIFVHLAELGVPETETDPATPLVTALQRRSGALTATGLERLVRQKLSEGHVLLLLDGWDELPPGKDGGSAAWLEQLLAAHPDTRVIVAAGNSGYGRLVSLGFVTSGIAPWRARRALALAQQWAHMAARPALPPPGWFWQPGDSPLTATLCLWQNLFRDRAKYTAPESRLFRRSVDLFVPEQVAAAGLAAAAVELWQRLAFQLLAADQLALDAQDVQRHVDELLAAHGPDAKAAVLWQAVRDSPLLRQWSDRRVSFLSPLWRDFLAARHLAATEEVEAVNDHLDDPRWRDAIRFYAAVAGENNLAAGLLELRPATPWHEELFQVAGWLPDAPPGRAWQRETLIQLGRLVVSPDVPLPLRQRAIAAIAHSGDPGTLPLLRQLLQRSDAGLRLVATAALARLDPERAVPVLEQLCDDHDPQVREAAVHSLGWQNSPRGEKALLSALVGADEPMARAAAEALAYNGGEGWEILQEAATDEMTLVRRAAARGLGAVREPWAADWLEKLERDDEWIVRSAATQELERIAGRRQEQPWLPLEAGNLVWLVQWAARRKRVIPMGAAAVPVLCEVLVGAYNADDRVAAATSLTRVTLSGTAQREAEITLSGAVEGDQSEVVRAVAFAALTELRQRMAA
jgi:HEAT repeat protein